MKNLMTIVVPCFNEEDALPLFAEAAAPIRKALAAGIYTDSEGNEYSFPPCKTEIIFIDDGSKDTTLSLLRTYHNDDPLIRYISFSRNFGKEAGIYAGLTAAKGDYVVLMDADLQHPIDYLPCMYSLLCSSNEEGEVYDSVAMYRTGRNGEGRLRAFFSKRFFRMINRISKIDLVDGATDFRMMNRKMVDAVLEMNEYNRFTKGIFNWVGFNTKWLPYESAARSAGSSKWSASGLFRYALEGMFAFSTTPLTISFTLGIVLCVLAVLYAIFTVVKTLIWGDPVAGFPSIYTMILLLGGIQLLFLGIMGQYMSKMYLEVKHRPIYITKETSED